MSEKTTDALVSQVTYLYDTFEKISVDYLAEMNVLQAQIEAQSNVFEAQMKALKNRYHQRFQFAQRSFKKLKCELNRLNHLKDENQVSEPSSD